MTRDNIAELGLKITMTGTAQAVQGLDSLTRSAENASKASEQAEQKVGTLDDVIRSLNPSALASVAGIGALVTAMTKLSQSAVAFGKNSIQTFSHFEQLESSLQGLMRDTEKGTELFEKLRKFSFDTTFGVDTLASASQALLGVGVEAEKLEDTLLMLGNVASGDTTKFNELVQIFSKIQNTGKASSIQLQQLALRGVPIYQMLKQIGVQGTATSKDITKAFQEMTAEGGQFYNAMERINGTIQGREGFVSDTWREFMAGFAEATGIADTYKTALDEVYNALQKAVDGLAVINDNPVYQALFSGVLLTGILSIGGGIAGTIIPVLKTVISQLVTIKALSAGSGIGLAIGAVAGATVALITATKKLSDARREEDTILKSIVENEKQLKELRTTASDTDGKSVTENVENQLALVRAEIEIAEGYMKLQEENRKSFEEYGMVDSGADAEFEAMQKEIDLLKEKEERLKRIQDVYKMQSDIQSQQNTALQNMVERTEELTAKAREYYNTTLEGQIQTLREQIKQAKEDLSREVTVTEDVETGNHQTTRISYRKKAYQEGTEDYELAIKYIDSLEEKLKQLEEQQDKVLHPAIEKSKGQEELERLVALTELYNEQLGKTAHEKRVLELQNEGIYKGYEEEIALQEELLDLAKQRIEAEEKLGNLKEEIGKSSSTGSLGNNIQNYFGEKLKNEGGAGNAMAYAGGGMVSAMQGTDTGTVASGAIQGFQSGGVIGAIIGAILGLLSTMQEFKDSIKELDAQLEPLKAILRPIIKLITLINAPLNAFARMLGNFLDDIFEPLMDALEDAIQFIYDLFGVERDVNKEKQTELERLKALNEQYSNLRSAIEQQEQYYLQKKMELNNDKNKAGITGVNDMILTPHGNFSTAPDDYIIATKNPYALGGGGSTINFTINNTVSNDVAVTAKKEQDGDMTNMVVTISRKVASDFATGTNGWDSAVSARQMRIGGRSVSK